MRRWFAALALAASLAAAAQAKPLDPALQQQLLGLYDAYNKAIAAGKLPDALALRSAETRTKAQQEFKTAKARQEFLAMAKMMIPDGLEVRHAVLSADGTKARVLTVAAKTFPPGKRVPGGPPPGTTAHGELTLSFVQEGGAWKLDDLLYGGDPAEIKACKYGGNEPPSAFDQDKDTNVGGPIVRVDFQPDYTVIVVRVLDEENCAFLPNKEEIAKHGIDTSMLVPYALIEIDGSPHKTDKQKVLVDTMKVTAEE